MVIRLNMIGDDNGDKVLRRTKAGSKGSDSRNTRAEFKRLKTILPSIRRKENVSKLDIILEAIKYIDDLTEQLEHRLEEDDDTSETSENVVGLADSPSEMQREAAAVMALAAEAQMNTTASGFYSDESPGRNSIQTI